MSSKIHLGKSHLIDAFRNQRTASLMIHGLAPQKLLLLVYAVECGLKAVLLDQRSLHSTQRLADEDFTHDLDELQRKVGRAPTLGVITAQNPRNLKLTSQTLHSLLRYGGKLAMVDMTALTTKLDNIVEWIEEQI